MDVLYKNIRYLRQQKGMSQAELAEKAGYNDRSSITKIENGDVDISRSKIELFAHILDVSIRELMDVDIEKWDQEAQHFSYSMRADTYLFKSIGWSVDFLEDVVVLTNGVITLKLTNEDYDDIISSVHETFSEKLSEVVSKYSIR